MGSFWEAADRCLEMVGSCDRAVAVGTTVAASHPAAFRFGGIERDECAEKLGEQRAEAALAPGEAGLVSDGLAEEPLTRMDVTRAASSESAPGPSSSGDGGGSAWRWSRNISTLGAMAWAVGSKLGTGRQNSSCAVAGWATHQRQLASRPAARASRPGSARAWRRAWLEVGSLAPFEERVVDGHQRIEVLVDRRRFHAESAGDLGEAEAVDALFNHDWLGDGQDLSDGLLTAAGPAVGGGAFSSSKHAGL